MVAAGTVAASAAQLHRSAFGQQPHAGGVRTLRPVRAQLTGWPLFPAAAAIVGDIRTSMLDEVDFTKEAQHLAQFAGYLDRAGLRRVATCPGVYRQFSCKRWVPPGLPCLLWCGLALLERLPWSPLRTRMQPAQAAMAVAAALCTLPGSSNGPAVLSQIPYQPCRSTHPRHSLPALAPLQGDGDGPAAGRAPHRPGRRAQHHHG